MTPCLKYILSTFTSSRSARSELFGGVGWIDGLETANRLASGSIYINFWFLVADSLWFRYWLSNDIYWLDFYQSWWESTLSWTDYNQPNPKENAPVLILLISKIGIAGGRVSQRVDAIYINLDQFWFPIPTSKGAHMLSATLSKNRWITVMISRQLILSASNFCHSWCLVTIF